MQFCFKKAHLKVVNCTFLLEILKITRFLFQRLMWRSAQSVFGGSWRWQLFMRPGGWRVGLADLAMVQDRAQALLLPHTLLLLSSSFSSSYFFSSLLLLTYTYTNVHSSQGLWWRGAPPPPPPAPPLPPPAPPPPAAVAPVARAGTATSAPAPCCSQG